MSLTAQTNLNQKLAKLRTHLNTPLYKNGYALVSSSLLTSALGMVYWLLAARFYTAEAIGISSALISMMLFIVNLSHLNLPNGLNRFVPGAGDQTKKLIGLAYATAVSISAIASIIFILGISYWAPSLETTFGEGRWLSILFVCATMGWCIFVLQDSALTGLRQAIWIPAENLAFALAKIALLVLVVSMFPISGVFVSWILPVFLLLPLINWLIFGKIIPTHPNSNTPPTESITIKAVGKFIFSDYVASAVWMATTNLLPLLVLETLGAAESAWFYLAWNISYALYLISRNMGMSLITEGSSDPSQLFKLAYQTVMKSFMIVIPIATALYIVTPILLSFYGSDYVANTAPLLRLFTVSAIPGTIITVYTGYLRVRKKMLQLVIILSGQGFLVLGFSLLWMKRFGLEGIGYGWLFTQVIIAGLIIIGVPKLLLTPWFNRIAQLFKGQESDGSPSSSVLDQKLNTLVFQTCLNNQSAKSRISLNSIIQAQTTTHGNVKVFFVGEGGKDPVAVFKICNSQSAGQSLGHHADTLRTVQTNRGQALQFAIPQILATYKHKEISAVLETKLPGITLDSYLEQEKNRSLKPIIENTFTALASYYQYKETLPINIPAKVLEKLVAQPIALIEKELGWLNKTFIGRKLQAITHELITTLQANRIRLGPIHGDLWPGNIMLDPETGQMTGLIDWETAQEESYPAVDLFHLLLTTTAQIENKELGSTVISTLKRPRSYSSATYATYDSNPLKSACESDRAIILLAWLHHLKSNLSKNDTFTKHYYWLFQNVISVLARI
ncbi:MAG: phosphotransferase [Anaerolineae bacterium]